MDLPPVDRWREDSLPLADEAGGPMSAEAFKQLAGGLAEAGRLEEAVAADRKAIELSPGYVGAHYHLSQCKTFTHGDPDLTALEWLKAHEAALEGHEQIALDFALAKAYEDIGEYRRSFVHLSRANSLKRSTFSYDVSHDRAFFGRVASVFGSELLRRFSAAGTGSGLPILIVGMPRSGTSLVEQVLASHPAVHAGGELQHLEDLVTAVGLLDPGGREFPEAVRGLRAADLGGLGAGYVERLGGDAGRARRVTDKHPLNFRYLGLARLIVPQAHVIHCVRDPVDTCLSCFSVHFDSLQFTSDLRELGSYYRAYERLMEHWRDVLPPEWMLDVAYEDVVDDIEGQARRIVAHCGLAWDDACLSFHSSRSTVRTASFAQVRRPVYHSSVARSRRFEQELEPLLAALRPQGSSDPTP